MLRDVSRLVIKTGMAVEQQIAAKYAARGTIVITGEYTAETLEAIPNDCEAIISLGVCGGLSPDAQIGQAFIYDRVVTDKAEYACDRQWTHRLYASTSYYVRSCWSTGQFNTANDEDQRHALFVKTGCWIIDDESAAVAEFAHNRGIAFAGLRTVSDGAEDNLPPAVVNALNPDGNDNLWAVIESVLTDPAQLPDLFKTANEARLSFAELARACLSIGPHFQWQ